MGRVQAGPQEGRRILSAAQGDMRAGGAVGRQLQQKSVYLWNFFLQNNF
jgi:hypothetical protein